MGKKNNKKKKKKKLGFTLIELLAVIIILSIIMIIAMPSISSYIDDSRRVAYVATIKDTLTSAGSLVKGEHMSKVNRETTYYIPVTCIKTEKGVPTSPYNDFDEAYLIAGYENNTFSFYWVGRDKSGMGIKEAKKINDITEDDIKSDISKSDIKIDKKIGNTTNIMVLDSQDCETLISK